MLCFGGRIFEINTGKTIAYIKALSLFASATRRDFIPVGLILECQSVILENHTLILPKTPHFSKKPKFSGIFVLENALLEHLNFIFIITRS